MASEAAVRVLEAAGKFLAGVGGDGDKPRKRSHSRASSYPTGPLPKKSNKRRGRRMKKERRKRKRS